MNSNNDSSLSMRIGKNDAVTPVGNSWIICKSKSYSGRVYYFNTVSGKAAWNLSDSEIEKARKTTLESEDKINLTDFPEPLESPQDYVCNQNPTVNRRTIVPKIYNNQIINNKFPRESHPSTSFNRYTQFNAINSVGFGIPTFTPLMNVPANSIIFTPQINTLQPTIDTNYDCMQNSQCFNSSVPLSNDFPKRETKNSVTPQFHPRINNQRSILQKVNAQNDSNSTIDLRQKLLKLRNRKQNFNNMAPRGPAHSYSSNVDQSDDKIVENEGNTLNDSVQAFPDVLIQDMDIVAINIFFGISAMSEYWFIVVDEDILLNYSNFIIKLVELDERCRLVIPQVVIIQIQQSTTSVHNSASLQAASFISEALESNVAIVDEDNYETDDYYENIFNCCLKLASQNCDVVFISEKEMSYNNVGFSLFTMQDIKAFLVNKVKEHRKITITIPNDDENKNISLNNNHQDNYIGVRLEETICKDSKGIQFSLSSKDISTQTEELSHTVDVAVQVASNITERTNKPAKKRRLRRTLSTSMSATPNNVSNAGTNTNTKAFIDASTTTEVQNSMAMFQILNKAMEDSLKMKSEEWVSRFVQIMEEALTQVLRQDQSFVLNMPPPWTIYEASECIKRKFSQDRDVLDAGSKLSDILFEMGGLRGKINNNVDPEMYMKMYSHGYNLVDALQNIIRQNEDLQIAGTSLIKLLSDIQNPHLDPSNSDSFIDIESSRLNESVIYSNKFIRNEYPKVHSPTVLLTECTSMSTDSTISKAPNPSDTKILRMKSVQTQNYGNLSREMAKNVSPNKQKITIQAQRANKNDMGRTTAYSLQNNKYNLRNKKAEGNLIVQDNLILSHRSPSKDKDLFLTNFNLKNRTNEISADTIDATTEINTHSFDDENTEERERDTQIFAARPEFEKKLRNNSITFSEDTFDDQKLDYEYENNDESFISEQKKSNKGERLVSDPHCLEAESCLKGPESYIQFLDEVGRKVKESFLKVYSFCDNSRNKLISSIDKDTKLQIRTKAEKNRTYMETMCISLKRILDRETNDSQDSARNVISKIGYEIKDDDEKELEYYRSFISECIIQGGILQQTLKLIMDATLENV